jgi:ATP-dependent DNA ligase
VEQVIDARLAPHDVSSRRGRGAIFELMCTNDLEGVVAKRLADPYDARVRWFKIKTRITRRRKNEASCLMGRGYGDRRAVKKANG